MPFVLTDRRKSDTAANGRTQPLRRHIGYRFTSDPQLARNIRVTLPPKPTLPPVPPRPRRALTDSTVEKTERSNIASSRFRIRSTSVGAAATSPPKSKMIGGSFHRPPNLPPTSPSLPRRNRSNSMSFECTWETGKALRRQRSSIATKVQSLVPPPLPPKTRHQQVQPRTHPFPATTPAKGKEVWATERGQRRDD